MNQNLAVIMGSKFTIFLNKLISNACVLHILIPTTFSWFLVNWINVKKRGAGLEQQEEMMKRRSGISLAQEIGSIQMGQGQTAQQGQDIGRPQVLTNLLASMEGNKKLE